VTVIPELRDEHSRPTVTSASKEDVQRFYDAYAPNWDKRFRDNRSAAHFHRRRISAFLAVAALQPDDVVLELGCGTAPYLGELPPIARYHGVDLSERMLDAARRRSAALGLADVATFSSGDAETLGAIPDASVTVVCFFGLIEHLFDPAALFRSCQRVLKPKGRIVGVCPNGWSLWYSVISPLVRQGVKHLSTDRYYTPREVRRYLRDSAFTDIAFRYWGFVPPGDLPDSLYPLARAAEAVAERTPLNRLAGGMTFRAVRGTVGSA
jgi:ubiquinone/menaquinone biosynthesis C-methylase UbiE